MISRERVRCRRDIYPEIYISGHTVKSCMTVIGRWRAAIRIKYYIFIPRIFYSDTILLKVSTRAGLLCVKQRAKCQPCPARAVGVKGKVPESGTLSGTFPFTPTGRRSRTGIWRASRPRKPRFRGALNPRFRGAYPPIFEVRNFRSNKV